MFVSGFFEAPLTYNCEKFTWMSHCDARPQTSSPLNIRSIGPVMSWSKTANDKPTFFRLSVVYRRKTISTNYIDSHSCHVRPRPWAI